MEKLFNENLYLIDVLKDSKIKKNEICDIKDNLQILKILILDINKQLQIIINSNFFKKDIDKLLILLNIQRIYNLMQKNLNVKIPDIIIYNLNKISNQILVIVEKINDLTMEIQFKVKNKYTPQFLDYYIINLEEKVYYLVPIVQLIVFLSPLIDQKYILEVKLECQELVGKIYNCKNTLKNFERHLENLKFSSKYFEENPGKIISLNNFLIEKIEHHTKLYIDKQKELYEKGNKNAAFNIGLILYNTNTTPKNFDNIKNWFFKSESPESYYFLGKIYQKEYIHDQNDNNLKLSENFYKKAIKAKNNKAYYQISKTSKSPNFYLQKGAEMNDSKCLVQQYYLYNNIEFLKKSLENKCEISAFLLSKHEFKLKNYQQSLDYIKMAELYLIFNNKKNSNKIKDKIYYFKGRIFFELKEYEKCYQSIFYLEGKNSKVNFLLAELYKNGLFVNKNTCRAQALLQSFKNLDGYSRNENKLSNKNYEIQKNEESEISDINYDYDLLSMASIESSFDPGVCFVL